MRVLIGFLRDERGSTAVEYGLIALGIALAIVVAVDQSGTNMANGVYADIGTLF